MSSPHTVAVTDGSILLERVRNRLSPAACHSWFGQAAVSHIDTERVEIAVSSPFVKSWIERNYLDILREESRDLLNAEPAVCVTLAASSPSRPSSPLSPDDTAGNHASLNETTTCMNESQGGATSAQTSSALGIPPKRESRDIPVRGYAKFGTFEVGESNRLAHAACVDLARAPGTFPLVILHGGHGCGKTHLLQATVAMSLELGHRAVYLPAGQLVQDVQKAFRTGQVEAWRARMAAYDLLAVDDLPTLSDGNKSASQKELTHLLDTLRLRGATVLFAQVEAPGDRSGFVPMLASRLAGGLSLPLHEPEESLRRGILHALAAARCLTIPPESESFLLQATGGNLRELEGAVQTLAALVTFGGVALTPERVRQAIRPFAPSSLLEINPGTVAQLVADTFRVPVGDLLGKGRTARIARLRRLAIHLVRRFSTASLNEIGGYFGGRTHATILSSLKTPALSPSDTEIDRNRIRSILCQLGCQDDPEVVFPVQDDLFP